MNITNIEVELRKIQALVSRWNEQGYVPQIEKNIALQRVQKFYELFLDLDTQPQIEYHASSIITPDPAQDQKEQQTEIQSPTVDHSDVVEYIEIEHQKTKPEEPQEETFTIFGAEISSEQKKRFTHNLFCNDPLVFHNEIAKLEQLRTLDEVLIYIGEKYAWAPDNASADEFVDIVASKF
ncbi:MAG: hypothetical protein RSF93_07875 [Mucinivorans sp.]